MVQKLIRIVVVLLKLSLIYTRELVVSSLRLAWDAITPVDQSRDAFVEVEMEPLPDAALLAYCILVAMTPGSLPVHVSPDRRKLIVHTMYLDDPAAFRAELARHFENHLRRLSS